MNNVVNEFNERMKELEKNVIDLNIVTKEMRESIVRQPLNNYGIYSAICVSTFDVWKQNRIQWFSPLFDNPKTEVAQLPWAAPISSFGGFDDCGSSWIPPAGSTVLVAFENGCSGATYYLGTTWCRERQSSRGNHDSFGIPVEEFTQLYSGRRNGYLLGENNGSQSLPPWNTESYNGPDIDSIQDLSNDPSVIMRMTYPNIYGFKTPEKHMMKMVDGDAKCNRKWKRLEIMSGNGNWMIFKDDHMHYCGQWAHPTCVNNEKDGDTSCIVGLPNAAVFTANPNGSESIDLSGNQPSLPPAQAVKSEKTGCSAEDRATIIGGDPDNQFENNQIGRNPFFKQQSECRPYKGPQTPQNNKCDLPQTGVQILSISGHSFVMDDSVHQPRGDMDWNRSTQPFDFGCDDKFLGRTYWKSTTGHTIELNDAERLGEGINQVRGPSNGIKLTSALGNQIFLCDEVDGAECDSIASENQGIKISSTSMHEITLSDGGNNRTYPCRSEGASPLNNANSAYMQLRSGYGLQITLNDSPSQQTTQGQSIDIIAPQKTLYDGSRPHIIQLQEGYEGIEESGYIQVRSGGNLFLYAQENALELIEGHKIVYTATDRLDYTENNFFHIGRGNHIIKVDEKIYLLAGRDFPPPPDPPNENDPSPPENLLRPELDTATNQATTDLKECVPGLFPVLVLVGNCVRASDRVYASCSNAAVGIGLGNLNIADTNCPIGDDLCTGGYTLS